MALLGNGCREFVNGRLFGATAISGHVSSALEWQGHQAARMRNQFAGGGEFSPVASVPSGVRPPVAWVMPRKAGGLATTGSVIGSGGVSSATMQSGYNIEATITGDGGVSSAVLGLIVSISATLTASGGITSAAANALATMVATLTGSSSVTATLQGLASLGAALSGSGSVNAGNTALMDITANIRGYGDLTPEGIRDSVWNAALASYQTTGSAGKALSTASSGGVDLNALAAAVWTYATRELTAGGGGGATAADIWSYATRTLTTASNSTFMTPLAFKVSTTTTAGDPGPGRIRWNNATQSAATELYIDTVTDDGLDIDNYIDLIPVGAMVYIQDRDNATNVQKWLITSIVHNAGWTQLGVSNLSFVGGSLPNNHAIVVMFNNQIAGALSTEQATQLAEIYRIHGLQLGFPLTVTATSRVSDGITQTIDTTSGTTVVTRT